MTTTSVVKNDTETKKQHCSLINDDLGVQISPTGTFRLPAVLLTPQGDQMFLLTIQ